MVLNFVLFWGLVAVYTQQQVPQMLVPINSGG